MTNKQSIRKKLITELYKLIIKEVLKYKKSLDTRGCKNKISYKVFISIFIKKLETNLTWDLLGNIYKISKSHIHSTYCSWTEYGVFKNAFNNFLKQYHLFIDNTEAYIDSTTIFNKYGYVNTVGLNTYESKKHKSNKLSIVASKNGIPLGIHIGNGNIHDLRLLIDTLPKKHLFNV
jgi:transposase